MPIVSVAEATDKKGKVKKGYRLIECKNGRKMYMTAQAVEDKPVKKKEKKQKVEKDETETEAPPEMTLSM